MPSAKTTALRWMEAVFIIGVVAFLIIYQAEAHPGISSALSCGGLDSVDLATHMNNQIDDRLGSLSSTTALALWTTRASVATSGPWERNAGSWVANGANDLDFTGVSPYKVDDISPNVYSYQQAGTLISPRHMVLAHHYTMPVGAKVIFVDGANVAYERTVTAVTQITSPAGSPDIDVALLNADVPDSITFYPLIASTTLMQKINRFSNDIPDFPIVSLNQNDLAYVHGFSGYNGLWGISTSFETFLHSLYSTNPYSSSTIQNHAKRVEFSGSIVSGDSGDANFFAIGNRLVLAGVHASPGAAFYIGAFIPQINSAMTSMGGGYQVTELDVSCFNSYSMNNAPAFMNTRGAIIDAVNANDIHPDVGEFQVDENVYFDTTDNPLFGFDTYDADGDGVIAESAGFPNVYFTLSTTTGSGAVLLSQPLSLSTPPYDPNVTNYFSISVRLKDTKSPNATTTHTSYVAIKDNNRPLFAASSYAFSLAENSAAGTEVGTLSAALQSQDDSLAYSLVTNPSGAFAISASTGRITVADASLLDYEATTSIALSVKATATLGSSRSASSTLQSQSGTSTSRVIITLTNVDESVAAPSVVSSGGGGSSGGATATYYPTALAAAPVPETLAAPVASAVPCSSGQVFSILTGSKCTSWNSSAPAASAASKGSGAVFSRSLSAGMSGEDVRSLQKSLNALGFTVASTGTGSPGKESTVFGPATKKALIKFQLAKGIRPAAGYFGPLTRSALTGNSFPTFTASPTGSLVSTLGLGSRGPEVKKMRTILRRVKYFAPYGSRATPSSAAAETDYFGPETEAALKRFQCDQGIACGKALQAAEYGVTGAATRAMLNAL